MNSTTRRLAFISGSAALTWLILVRTLGTYVLTEAYAGRGLGLLARTLSARRAYVPLGHYLERLQLLAFGGAIAIVGGSFLLKALVQDTRQGSPRVRKLIGAAPPTSLAGIRISVCTIVLGITLLEDPASTAALPGFSAMPSGLSSMALLQKLPGTSALLSSAPLLNTLKGIAVLALIFGLLGLWTRISLPVALFISLLLGGVLRIYTHFFHSGLLPLYVLLVLSFSPCADALSLDAWRKTRRGAHVHAAEEPSLRYGVPRFLCWSMIGLSYFGAGTSKLRHGGFGWWDGINLKAKILGDALQVGSFDFPFLPILEKTPLYVFSLMGIATLVIELSMVLVPFSRLARRTIPLGVMGLHLGIFLAQEILFLDLILVQAIFFNFRAPLRSIYNWLNAKCSPARSSETLQTADAPASVQSLTAVVLVFALYLGVIALNVEFYPLTTWSMYSDRTRSSVVEYILFSGQDAMGRKVPVRLEKFFGVFRLSRDFDVIPLAFRPASRIDLERTLDAFANAYNAQRPAAERLKAVHFERRHLDFAYQSLDPLAGNVVERFEYEPGSR